MVTVGLNGRRLPWRCGEARRRLRLSPRPSRTHKATSKMGQRVMKTEAWGLLQDLGTLEIWGKECRTVLCTYHCTVHWKQLRGYNSDCVTVTRI